MSSLDAVPSIRLLQESHTARVALTGPLDAGLGDLLEQSVADAFELAWCCWVDMTEVTAVDAGIIETLTLVHERALHAHCCLLIASPERPEVLRTFAEFGLLGRLPFAPRPPAHPISATSTPPRKPASNTEEASRARL